MSPRRMAGGGALVLALVAVVGLASRAHTGAGGGQTHTLSHDILLEYALLLIIAASVVVIPVVIYLFIAGKDDVAPHLPRRGNWMIGVFVSMSVFFAIAVIKLSTHWFDHHHGHSLNPFTVLRGIAGGVRAPSAPRFDWGPVVVISTLTALVVAAGIVLLIRRREPALESARAASELAVALDRTIADLRAEPDPRKAVIAAYAQMERALARAGLPRETHEAPREYLGRVLPEVGAGSQSIERLTELFERARFSPHAIDAEMKDEAISALEALRDELRSEA